MRAAGCGMRNAGCGAPGSGQKAKLGRFCGTLIQSVSYAKMGWAIPTKSNQIQDKSIKIVERRGLGAKMPKIAPANRKKRERS